METPKFKKTIMKTFQFAELHFKWNAMIRTNLLIYQNFTLGLFLNLAKGYRQSDRALLKVSFVLSVISLLAIYSNGYILYYIVEKYYKKNETMLIALKEKRELLANRQNDSGNKKKKIHERGRDTIDHDDSVMELKPRSNQISPDKKRIQVLKKKKKNRLVKGRKNTLLSKKKDKNIKNKKDSKPQEAAKPAE